MRVRGLRFELAALAELLPESRGTAASSIRVYGCWGSETISSVGPTSTIRPRYMTATMSLTNRTVARLWETKIIEIPSSRCSLRTRLRIVLWTETSRRT